MTTKEKVEAILEAVKSKKVSSYQLDETGKGKALTRIKQGKASQEIIDKIYATLLSITKDNQVSIIKDNQVSITKDNQISITNQEKDENIELDTIALNRIAQRLEKLERENKELKEKLVILEREINQLKDNQVSICLKDFERFIVDGIDFIIRQEKQTTNITLANGESKQVSYGRYYAKKKIAGKLHRIYIGDIPDRRKVEQKIKAYCEKHSLLLPSVV